MEEKIIRENREFMIEVLRQGVESGELKRMVGDLEKRQMVLRALGSLMGSFIGDGVGCRLEYESDEITP